MQALEVMATAWGTVTPRWPSSRNVHAATPTSGSGPAPVGRERGLDLGPASRVPGDEVDRRAGAAQVFDHRLDPGPLALELLQVGDGAPARRDPRRRHRRWRRGSVAEEPQRRLRRFVGVGLEQLAAGPLVPLPVDIAVVRRGVAHSAIVDTAGITGSLRPVSKCNDASGRGAGHAAGSLGALLMHVNRDHAQPTSGSGSAGTPPISSWKWRCDPTERPVLPTDPTLWPCWTSSPTLTAVSSMWA